MSKIDPRFKNINADLGLASRYYLHVKDVDLDTLPDGELAKYDAWLGGDEGKAKLAAFKEKGGGKTTAIQPASVGLPTQPISNSADLGAALGKALSEHLNIMGGLSAGVAIPTNFSVSLRVEHLPLTDAALWYDADGGKKAPSKNALNRLAALAGVSIRTRRVDDRSDPLVCEFEATARIRDLDGTWREITDNKRLDLRDGSPQARALKDRQLAGQRGFIDGHCETKAKNRAIRAILGIPTGMDPKAAARPWVIAKLQYSPDLADPEIRRMQAAAEFGVVGALYGAAPARPVIEAIEPEPEFKPVGEHANAEPFDMDEEAPWTE